MNIYFLVEGKRTEVKVYPKWLSILVPALTCLEANDPNKITDNQYYLFNGGGYPNILDDMINAINDINNINKFTYFVVCLDADEFTVNERIDEIKKRIETEKLNISAELVIIVQNRCFETWFLGNTKVYTRNPQGDFLDYSKYYNVSKSDPELMGKINGFEGSISIFHEKYLEKMLLEKNMRYSKCNPYSVCEEAYLKQLISRTENTNHLVSLKTFLMFCEQINREIAAFH